MQINPIHHIITFAVVNIILVKANTQWPSGSYGLPRPINGCPDYWKDGFRYQDTEDEHSINRHSQSYHLSGRINKHGIRQEFCMKDESLFEKVDVKWPDGNYCIYKYGNECPAEFKEGWVFWDDENIEELDGGNSIRGEIPEGVYERDTLMYFCCNDKGNVSIPIELPLNNPFYLLAFKSKECQKVKSTTVTSEFIHWDDEDRGNRNAHSKYVPYGVELDAWDTMMYFCYYDTGICGKYGTSCKNISVVEANMEAKMERKNTVLERHHGMHKKHYEKERKLLTNDKKSSTRAVVIGCSIAGVILGTALAGIMVKHVLNKRMAGYKGLNGDVNLEETLPHPDHIW